MKTILENVPGHMVKEFFDEAKEFNNYRITIEKIPYSSDFIKIRRKSKNLEKEKK